MKTFLLLLLVITVAGCGGSQDTTSNPNEVITTPDWQSEKLIWMEMEPVQCLGNPWQQYWIRQEGRTEADYPMGNPRIVEAQEKEIIMNYYSSLGIDVVAVDSRPFPDDRMVCEACSCPQGYTLFLKVLQSDAPELSELGFKQSERL